VLTFEEKRRLRRAQLGDRVIFITAVAIIAAMFAGLL
jgi:hypothetical protein